MVIPNSLQVPAESVDPGGAGLEIPSAQPVQGGNGLLVDRLHGDRGDGGIPRGFEQGFLPAR
jgi:hypothetical protein